MKPCRILYCCSGKNLVNFGVFYFHSQYITYYLFLLTFTWWCLCLIIAYRPHVPYAVHRCHLRMLMKISTFLSHVNSVYYCMPTSCHCCSYNYCSYWTGKSGKVRELIWFGKVMESEGILSMVSEIDVYHSRCVTVVLKRWRKQMKR